MTLHLSEVHHIMEETQMKYRDLIFDLYGTLVDIHTEESDTVWEKTALYFGFIISFFLVFHNT